MVALSSSPSPFATLLRRSKFATYDPRIAQVFTTYGGHAHRGDWGFKRPIGVRRRGAFITVKSIDTPAQQTEWSSGGKQAKWIHNWEELNYEAKVNLFSRWNHITASTFSRDLVDSEFAPMKLGAREGEMEGWRSQVVRNIHAMSPREFRTYLEKLREKRPEFVEFLRKKAETDIKMKGLSAFQLAQQQKNHHVEFIAEETSKAVNSIDSRVIDPVPHKTGGALYSHPSSLQTFLDTKPQPGRILADNKKQQGRQRDTYVVSFGGMTRKAEKRYCSGIQRMNWNNPSDDSRSVSQFRVEYGWFRTLPRVVGKTRQGLRAAKSGLLLRSVPSGPDFGRSNPYTPGSLAYVSAVPAPPEKKGARNTTPQNIAAANRTSQINTHEPTEKTMPSNALNKLKRLIQNNSADRDPYSDDRE